MSHQWMPPAPTGPIVKNITLGKGKACICCRRRKMRCDGTHPICRQCIANGREMDCEYSDGVNPTRTERLEERLSQLQERLRDLEGGGAGTGDESSGSSHGGRGSSSSRSRDSHATRGSKSISRLLERSSSGTSASTRWWDAEIPPAQTAQTLIETFLHHREQLGFALNTPRLLTALATPFSSTTYPHKALLNAIFLWGVRISSSYAATDTAGLNSTELRQLREQERAFFERAARHLQLQLHDENPRRGLQSVQAEVLLATYLFATGRALEGTYHVNAAMTLATTFGIHRVRVGAGTGHGNGGGSSSSRRGGGSSRGGNTIDVVEEGERICTFWRVFELDRCWAIASGSVAILQDRDSSARIDTPWPFSMAEYEAGHSHNAEQELGHTVKNFMDNRGRVATGWSPLALSSKAALLSEQAARLASVRATSGNDPDVFSATRTLDETIVVFISSLAPIPEDSSPVDRAYLVSTHIQAYASLIHLHDSVSQNDATAYTSCVNAAKLIAAVICYLREGEARLMGPFVTTSLTITCKVLAREIAVSRFRGQASTSASTGVETELNKVMLVMTQLRTVYPVVNSQVSSIEEVMRSLNVNT